MSAENRRRIVELHVEHFVERMKFDSDHHNWFMVKLAEVAKTAKIERQKRRPKRRK